MIFDCLATSGQFLSAFDTNPGMSALHCLRTSLL